MANARRVALLFAGQGSQYPRMAAGLYGHDDAFTATMDQAFELLADQGPALRGEWLGPGPQLGFDDVTRAQPLLYAVEVALGRMVLTWGVAPVAMLGHSVGEMVACTLAGVLTFAEGVELMRDRARHYAASPPGGMLAVAASAAEVTPFLSGRVVIAAVNAPQQTVLAGERADLDAAQTALSAAGYTCMPARARQAFHSPVVAEAAAATVQGWQAVRLGPPRVPVYSAHLGAVLDARHATDPLYWAMQPTTPVLFWPTLELLLAGDDLLLVEVGPGQGLITLARRHPSVATGRHEVIALLPGRAAAPAAERAAVAAAAARIADPAHPPRPAAIAR